MVLQNCKSVTLNATEEEDGVEEDEEEEDAPLRLLLPSSIVVVVVVVVVVGGVDREEVKFSDSDLDIMDDFNDDAFPTPPADDAADEDCWEESWSISSKLDIMGFTYNNCIAAITSEM